jgi:GAF domain-containing protein
MVCSEMTSPMPENELARLEALRRYRILDTAPEEAFDDITQVAAFVCGTPIALLVLVDHERQWFKATVGLEASETPRDVAFCSYTILQSELLVVPDARADARFADNLLVTSFPHIRFYAGAPLLTQEGLALGSLCVIDQTPREITAAQRKALAVLARQVSAQMELRRVSMSSGDAVAALQALQGILTICSYCKDIRDNQGTWRRLEEYLQAHTEAKFSHSMCQDCLRKHHPDFLPGHS